jgi:hypothetical protein
LIAKILLDDAMNFCSLSMKSKDTINFHKN